MKHLMQKYVAKFEGFDGFACMHIHMRLSLRKPSLMAHLL